MTIMAHAPEKNRTEETDDVLLSAIADRRDREAFTALYERYRGLLFNVARFICGNWHLAEEAVQAAMVDVWRNAKDYRAGNARGWIMQIMARHARKMSMRAQRKTQKEKESQMNESSKADGPPDHENLEVRTALRCILEELPSSERCLVMFYFAADFSQEQIAKEFKISQRAVSARVKKTLETLRVRLSQAGYAATGLLTSTSLKQVLRQADPVPDEVSNRVLEKIVQGLEETVPAKGGVGIAVCCAVLLAGLGAVWAVAGLNNPGAESKQKAERLERDPQPDVRKLGQPPEKAASKPLHKHWYFDQSLPKEVKWKGIKRKEYTGEPRLIPARGKRKACLSAHASEVHVELPIAEFPNAFRVLAQFVYEPKPVGSKFFGGFGCILAGFDKGGRRLKSQDIYKSDQKKFIMTPKEMEKEWYRSILVETLVVDARMYVIQDGKVNWMGEFNSFKNDTLFEFHFFNLALESLEIRELAPEQAAAEAEKLMRQVKALTQGNANEPKPRTQNPEHKTPNPKP